MTPAEINRRVAEIAGWTSVRLPNTPNEWHETAYGVPPDAQPGEYDKNYPDDPCPNFAHSLDAIVPVVREWCEKMAVSFILYFNHVDRTNRLYEAIIDGSGKRHRVLSGNPATALSLALIAAVEATGA